MSLRKHESLDEIEKPVGPALSCGFTIEWQFSKPEIALQLFPNEHGNDATYMFHFILGPFSFYICLSF